MAFTVTGKNYAEINDGEASSDWTGLNPDDVTDFYKYGTQCVGFELWGSGTNDTSISGSWDLSTYSTVRWWMMTTVLNELDTDANGGIQLGLSDGTNTGYWYVSGSTTYPGGWWNPVVDVSGSPDTGSQPTLSAITGLTLRFILTSGAKKTQSLWIDHISRCDGLVISGNTASAYADFDDVFTADSSTSLATGVIRKIGGTFFVTGVLEFGLGSGASEDSLFQALSQDVVFEDRPVASDLYGLNIVDDGSSYTTKFILGDKVGTAGVQGCKIKVQSSSQTGKFYVDAQTDTDVDFFKLYGSTFYGASTIEFPATGSNVEILSCNFESCGQVDPSSAEVRSCFFIDTSSSDGALIWGSSIDVESCSFIGNTTGPAIEHDAWNGTAYGTATNTGSETTTLYDTGASFLSTVAVNDIVYNETDLSWGRVTAVVDDDEVTHTALTDSGVWDTSDAYSFATPYSYTSLVFSGNTYDVDNTTSPANVVGISKAGTSNPTSYPTGDFVAIQGSVTVTITVKDVAGDEIENAQTAIFASDDGTEIMNEDTNVSGIASTTYAGSTPREVNVWIRKASSGATKYKNYSSVQNITASGLTLSVTLVEDPNNNATT